MDSSGVVQGVHFFTTTITFSKSGFTQSVLLKRLSRNLISNIIHQECLCIVFIILIFRWLASRES